MAARYAACMRLAIPLLLLTLLACALPAHAQDKVYRCIDAHGTPVFGDQPCTTLAAMPVQPSTVAAPATPALQHCAASPAALRQRVIEAFAARDPNRLAGLMLWHGYGSHAAVGDIRTLATLVREPLVGIHFGANDEPDPASAASAPLPAPTADASSLQVRTGGAEGRSARFRISRQAGCLWLRFAG